jgi:hypothetical protein
VWGVYTYRPPQKGVGPPAVRLLGVRKEIPLTIKHPARRCFSHNICYIALSVSFMDTCPKNACAHRLAWNVLANTHKSRLKNSFKLFLAKRLALC